MHLLDQGVSNSTAAPTAPSSSSIHTDSQENMADGVDPAITYNTIGGTD